MSKTRADLIQLIASRFGHYHKGSATGGNTTSITDPTLLEPDDHWNQHYVYVVSAGGAAPEGEERRVSDYAQASHTLTIEPAFSAGVQSGDVFELLKCRRQEAIDALNEAIREADGTWLIETEDNTSITIATTTYQYSLPADLVYLVDVQYRAGATDPWKSVNTRLWWTQGPPGAAKLCFYDISDFAVGNKLQLVYLAHLAPLVADATVLNVGSGEDELVAFLEDWALYNLHDLYSSVTQGDDFRSHYTKSTDRRASALDRKRRYRNYHSAGKIHLPRRSTIRG